MKGTAEMLAKLKKVTAIFPERVGASLYKRGQIIMTASKRLCPVGPDGGTLRASGMVHPPERVRNTISVTLSYGGAAEAYAIAVHEHLSEHSPPSWRNHPNDIHWNAPGTGPKFLERPINDAQSTLAHDVASDIHLEGLRL